MGVCRPRFNFKTLKGPDHTITFPFSWSEPFAYALGGLGGNDGWANGPTVARTPRVTANGVSSGTAANSQSINAANPPAIDWTQPWRLTLSLFFEPQVAAAATMSLLPGINTNQWNLQLKRGLSDTSPGQVNVALNDGIAFSYNTDAAVPDNTSTLLVIYFDGAGVTVALDGVNLFGSPQPFTPDNFSSGTFLSWAQANTTANTLLRSLLLEWTA